MNWGEFFLLVRIAIGTAIAWMVVFFVAGPVIKFILFSFYNWLTGNNVPVW